MTRSVNRRPWQHDEQSGAPLEQPQQEELRGDQLSLFAALSATPIGEPTAFSPWHEPLPDDWGDGSDATIEVELAPRPLLAAGLVGGRTRREVKNHLRTLNADVAREIARVAGLTHARVNRELNRLACLRSISEATEEQLRSRLTHDERWRARHRR